MPQTSNSNNNVFERLYKKQLQNIRVTPTSVAMLRSH